MWVPGKHGPRREQVTKRHLTTKMGRPQQHVRRQGLTKMEKQVRNLFDNPATIKALGLPGISTHQKAHAKERMPKTSTSMPGISTDPSLRKIFELKYHHPQGQWNVMTRPNILGGSRHDIIMSQAANIPVIPGCFDDVKHSRIDERQTFSKHECTFSSSLHWFEGVSCCMNPVVMPEQGKEKGFMVTCMGHSINIEDAATKTCCRDQRDVCYVVAPLAQGGMEFARKLALNTFYDCLVETQVIVDQQSTGGDFGCPVVFTSSADAVQTSQGVFAGDRATKCMDQMMIMFLGNCFFMCRAMVHLQSMDNFSAKGSYWQASSFFTDQAFVFACSSTPFTETGGR